MKKVIVFGANGQLGTDLVKKFQANPSYSVLALDKEQVDFANENELVLYLQKNILEVDYVISCVALTNTSFCELNIVDSYKVNAFPQAVLARFCQNKGAKLIYFSTDYVFSGTKKMPYTETDIPDPVNVYGASKLAGENLVRAYCDQHFIFRISSLFGVAGALGKGGNFVETMIAKAKNGEELKVIGDQIMSPTSTEEVVKAIFSFVEKGIEEYGTYHLVGRGECSWYEFTREIFKQCKINHEIKNVSWRDFPSPLKRPIYSVMATNKIQNHIVMLDWQSHLKNYLIQKGHIK